MPTPPELPAPPEAPVALPEPAPEPSKLAASLVAAASFLAIFLLFFAGQFIQLLNLPFGLLVTSLFVFGAAGLVFPTALNLRPAQFTGLARIQPGLVVLAFVAGLANMGFANFLMGALREELPRQWSDMADNVTRTLVNADRPSRIVIVLAAGVAAPIGEELFFRGWLQGLLGRRFGRIASIVTVAVIFSFTHLDPVGFLPRVELGVLFGLMRAWTGSLYPAIAAHAAHNLVSTAVLYFSEDPLADIDQPFQWGSAAALGAGSLVATIVVLAVVHRLAPRSHVDTPEPVQPVKPDVPPFRIVPRQGLLAMAFAALVLFGSTVALAVFATRLPGSELTRSVREKMLKTR